MAYRTSSQFLSKTTFGEALILSVAHHSLPSGAGSPGDLVNVKFDSVDGGMELRFGLSVKIPGDANVAGQWAALSSRVLKYLAFFITDDHT